ncbi:hypothetical protein TEA_014892 [Camellia sinensis var. sinensis]|uniref:Sugar phosphate transporter domain-containing protein n=1 Tax=Camellia sinensis var. sinensis TaxID=542762 RepID=A0A4S4E016_CAMSN|nr:hypothetical protein TEA_014892 [Camellia sinensis var. sinensis]
METIPIDEIKKELRSAELSDEAIEELLQRKGSGNSGEDGGQKMMVMVMVMVMVKEISSEVVVVVVLFAALSYGIASMAMVFINKAVLMQYASSMTLLTLQQLATTMLIYCGRVMGYTKAKGVNVETAKKLILVSLFYNANVAFALASLKGVNIPMYIAIKRLTPLAVLIAGFFSGKGRPSTQVILSVVLTAAGVMIAALGDFSFDLVGYSMAFTSVFFQTMYLVLVEKSGAEDGLSSVEIMFYNSFLSLPFLTSLVELLYPFVRHSIFYGAPSLCNRVCSSICLTLRRTG